MVELRKFRPTKYNAIQYVVFIFCAYVSFTSYFYRDSFLFGNINGGLAIANVWFIRYFNVINGVK